MVLVTAHRGQGPTSCGGVTGASRSAPDGRVGVGVHCRPRSRQRVSRAAAAATAMSERIELVPDVALLRRAAEEQEPLGSAGDGIEQQAHSGHRRDHEHEDPHRG